jgi:hydrogenase maturation protease
MEAEIGMPPLDSNREKTIVVAGFGSPHGDDQAGWQVVALLEQRRDVPARLAKVVEGTQIIDLLNGCVRLLVIDACRSGSRLGDITRFEWPDPRVMQYHNQSTHGIGLCNGLQLADRLGRLPPLVEVFGIEIGSCRPLDEVSAEVIKAVGKLAKIISAELCEVVHA